MERGGVTKTSREALEFYRFQAVRLRKSKWKVNDIAEAFGVHEGSVSRWLITYRKEGLSALKRTKARGKESKLSPFDKKKIVAWLRRPATDFGFETPLWTCKRVQQLIKHELSISIHVTKVWLWLKQWNLTNQKPQRRAQQRKEEEVQHWLKEEWPKIKAHAKRWQAMLYFEDEAGISLTAVMGKTWAPKGQTPIIKVTGNRGGFCITSAISPAGKMVFRIETGKVTAEKHIEFLEHIMKHHPNRKIIVVEDKAPAHRSKKVDEFVHRHKKRLALYKIPSYSPELNPDEHVWAYLKAHQLKGHQAQTTDEMRHLVKNKMHGIQRRKALVNSFFMQSILTQS